MKTKKTLEVTVCDQCQEVSEYPKACMGCGMDFCFKCSEIHAVRYPQSLYVSGGDDGFYCNACDGKLTQSGADKRHAVYLKIRELGAEINRQSTANTMQEQILKNQLAEAIRLSRSSRASRMTPSPTNP